MNNISIISFFINYKHLSTLFTIIYMYLNIKFNYQTTKLITYAKI